MFMNMEIERLRRHMSKAEMASKLDTTQATLNDWIHRRNPIPADKLRAISRLFGGMSLDYLLQL